MLSNVAIETMFAAFKSRLMHFKGNNSKLKIFYCFLTWTLIVITQNLLKAYKASWVTNWRKPKLKKLWKLAIIIKISI